MKYPDTQQVCLNGHQITDMYYNYQEDRKEFCDKCGEKTIYKCPNCKEEIIGSNYISPLSNPFTRSKIISDPNYANRLIPPKQTPVPDYCHNCGKPYPWTERKQKLKDAVKDTINSNSIILIEKILSRFHLVVKQLQERHNNRTIINITDEYDVQDLLHSLLKIFFDDIRPEEWTPSYAGSSSRMDFLLKEEKIVIEAKKTRKGLGNKVIGEQLIIDIEKYRVHQSCKTLICFVYDPEGKINNPLGLENDLSRVEDGLIVKVIIVPKGY